MNRLTALVVTCAAAFVASLALAQSSPLIVKNAWMRQVPGASTAAVYLVLQNTSAEPVIVIGAHSPAAKHVMIHETKTVNGKSQMRHRDKVVIAPGQSVTFEPGGLHVMFTGMKSSPATGTTVPLVLLLANGGKVEVAATVRPLDAQ